MLTTKKQQILIEKKLFKKVCKDDLGAHWRYSNVLQK